MSRQILALTACVVVSLGHLLLTEFMQWTYTFLLSFLAGTALVATLLVRTLSRLPRWPMSCRLPTTESCRQHCQQAYYELTYHLSTGAFFLFYAASLADLEFSALAIFLTLVVGTVSCVLGGAWILVIASVCLALGSRAGRWQKNRIERMVALGRHCIFSCVSLLKPPN